MLYGLGPITGMHFLVSVHTPVYSTVSTVVTLDYPLPMLEDPLPGMWGSFELMNL